MSLSLPKLQHNLHVSRFSITSLYDNFPTREKCQMRIVNKIEHPYSRVFRAI